MVTLVCLFMVSAGVVIQHATGEEQSDIYCSLNDLKPGLKPQTKGKLIIGRKVMYSFPLLCYGIYHEAETRATCIGPRKWSPEYPPCKSKLCESPVVPDGMSLHITGRRVHSNVTYVCPEGYWYDGTNPRICQLDQNWSGHTGNCMPVQCSALSPPKNGFIRPPPPYKYKSSVLVSCEPGFVFDKSNELICVGNNMWSDTVGQCIEISSICCSPLTAVPNSVMIGEHREAKFKSQVTISCEKGYHYNGSLTRTCQADSTWSGMPGLCNVVTCMPLNKEVDITAQNGTEFISLLLNHSIPANHSRLGNISVRAEYGDTVEVKCPEGYIYNGSLLRCNEDGHWEGHKGSCQAVSCEKNPNLPHGALEGSDFVFKDVTNVVCHTGYRWEGSTPHAICTSNCTWSFNGKCLGVPCPDESEIYHGSLEGSGHVFPNKANISCNHGYQWQGSIPHAECTSDGTWKFTGHCQAGQMDKMIIGLVVSAVITLLIAIGTLLIRQSRIKMALKRHRPTHREREVNDTERVPLIEMHGNTDNPIREAVIQRGHVINRNPDKRINLDNQFVKLRLVTGEGYDRMDEINDALPDRYQDYLQRAGAENVEMEDILNHVNEETVDGVRKRMPLLMEGRAGVGKSTLVQKLMRMWAQNVWAKEYKAAFLFNIRNLTVHDKRKIPLVDLFRFYSLYTTKEGTGSLSAEILENEEENILVFIDGVDEFPGLQETLKDFERLSATDQAEPMEWCINLLRRNVMGKSVLILASRPFKDLKHVNCSPILEVVGLTQDAIIDFIDHHVEAENIERVQSLMESNPLVMSVSAITYFCLMFCMVLEEDENVSTTELTTYTRITAFFIEHYMKRCKSPNQGRMLDESSFLPPLTRLAYRGLIERYQMGNQVRLVFDQKDLEKTGVTEKTRQASEESGILVTTLVKSPINEASTKLQMSEFVHLSIQELLAMLELLQQSKIVTIRAAYKMWQSGGFLMAQQYLFGLCYDQENTHIKKLLQATVQGAFNPAEREEGSHDLVQGLINRLEADKQEDSTANIKLQAIQMVYETQRQDVAGRVARVLFKDTDEMFFHDTLLTAVDMNAIVFLLSQLQKDCKLRLEKVVMDVSSENVLAENLIRCQTLRSFMLRETKLSELGAKELMNGLPQKQLLKELTLDNVGLCVEKEEHLGNALQQMSSLSKLSLDGSRWSKDGLKALVGSLKKLTSLKELSLANAELDDDTIIYIIAILEAINILKLSLSGNKFGQQGIQHVANWLKNNTSLQHLSLAHTGMVYQLVEKLLTAVKTNKTLKTLDIRGEKMQYRLIDLLKDNTTLDTLWYTYRDDDTCTLVAVPDTGRRVEVSTGGDETRIRAWCLEDITSSSCLHHHHTVWGQEGGKLVLQLQDRYTDLYGAERPPVTTDTWCHTLNQLTSSTHRVGVLSVFLSNSASLSPLLSSLTHDMIHTLIHSQVGRVRVYYGEVTCSDLLTWLSSLSSQPGWSVRAHASGTEVTNIHSGQSVVIVLWYTRVLASLLQKQRHQKHLGQGDIRLLDEPEWVVQ